MARATLRLLRRGARGGLSTNAVLNITSTTVFALQLCCYVLCAVRYTAVPTCTVLVQVCTLHNDIMPTQYREKTTSKKHLFGLGLD